MVVFEVFTSPISRRFVGGKPFVTSENLFSSPPSAIVLKTSPPPPPPPSPPLSDAPPAYMLAGRRRKKGSDHLQSVAAEQVGLSPKAVQLLGILPRKGERRVNEGALGSGALAEKVQTDIAMCTRAAYLR